MDNTLCLSPHILNRHCFQFLLGLNNGPKRKQKQCLCKICGYKQRVSRNFPKWPMQPQPLSNRLFSRDVTAAMLVSLNKGAVVMLMSPSNPPGIGLYYNANVFFCFGGKTRLLIT